MAALQSLPCDALSGPQACCRGVEGADEQPRALADAFEHRIERLAEAVAPPTYAREGYS